MGIYDTHLTTSESDNENTSGSRSLVSLSDPKDDQTLQRRRAELYSNALHDPTRISVTSTPPPPSAQTVKQAPLVPRVQALPPRSLSRLKGCRIEDNFGRKEDVYRWSGGQVSRSVEHHQVPHV
uniref:Integrase core domain containing protein n=1 Tax=Solanum tuberosum TaxID=4113 RepID=M1CJX2_SOLTU